MYLPIYPSLPPSLPPPYSRLLRTQSLEWYYNNVKNRFKRFGSAKVLKNLYRKHRLETGAYSDMLGKEKVTGIESPVQNKIGLQF